MVTIVLKGCGVVIGEWFRLTESQGIPSRIVVSINYGKKGTKIFGNQVNEHFVNPIK